MISIDTNILVRVFLEDDPKQTKVAQNIMRHAMANDGLFISSYVLLEFAWVLKAKKFTRKEIYVAITTLTNSKNVHFARNEIIKEALEFYIKGKADFGDCMMRSESFTLGAKSIETFDRIFESELQSHKKSAVQQNQDSISITRGIFQS